MKYIFITISISILLLGSLTQQSSLLEPSDFKQGLFQFNSQPSGLYHIELGDLSDTDEQNIMMAFGDFDGNKHTDVVTINAQRTQIMLYLWEEGKYEFVKTSLSYMGGDTPQFENIINIIPVDINYDNQLDMVVITESDSNIFTSYVLTRKATCNTDTCEFLYQSDWTVDGMTSQPMIVDISQAIKSDAANEESSDQIDFSENLFFFDGETQTRKFVIVNTEAGTYKTKSFKSLIDSGENCVSVDEIYKRDFATPHFSSTVDINGDCRSDLVIHSRAQVENTETEFLEFWIRTDGDLFCLKKDYQIPNTIEIKSLSLSDINYDGGIDIVMFFYETTEPATYQQIAYNNILVNIDSLCTGKDSQDFYNWDGLFKSESSSQTFITAIDYQLYSKQKVTSNIRFGDFDFDSYPEIILTLYDPKFSTLYKGKSYYFFNHDCSEANAPAACALVKDVDNPRFFSINQPEESKYTKYADTFNELKQLQEYNSTQIAFLDVNEDGKLDFLVNYEDDDGNSYVTCYYNYISTDNFFLKVLGLNGCQDNSEVEGGRFSESKYSNLYYGATYECKITQLDSTLKAAKGVQLTQSAHNPMQLPFTIIGLARTNNYVENLVAGYPIGTEKWSPIIPNSQLIINPDGTDSWSIGIFIQPTKALWIVIIVTTSILFLLGIVILIYHKKEKEEDKKDMNTNWKFIFK